MKIKVWFFTILFTILTAILLLRGNILNGQTLQGKQSDNQSIPKDPLIGRIVFENKGCIECHSINGSGGHTAPDFGTNNYLKSEYDLITGMWNHSPNMFIKMVEIKADQQKFNTDDFRNLRFFLYYLRYLGGTGNISKGQELFVKMRCDNCHSVGKPGSGKIELDKIGVYASPLFLAQTMWNHSVLMQKKRKSSNIKLQIFKGNEFGDLSAYIAEVSTYGKRNKIYMSPGNPVKGEKIYQNKGCFYCHDQKPIGPDLNKYDFNKSVTEVAGMMWNHSVDMALAMSTNKMSWPEFKGDEMTNLISYLYFKYQSKINGSAEEGKQLIKDKGCIDCHTAGNTYKAPAATAIGPFRSEDDFFSELWNHMPLMENKSYARGKSLPKLMPSDAKSLYLYFNRNKR
jgi:cytochrome c551/c552